MNFWQKMISRDNKKVFPKTGYLMFIKLLILNSILLLSSGLSLSAENAALGGDSKRYICNRLLFFFDADTKILSQDRLNQALKQKNSATGRVFRRIMKNRENSASEENYIDKKNRKTMSDKYVFSKKEIRDAAFVEVMSLGDEVIELLIENIFSSRDGVRIWTIKSLLNYKTEEVVEAFSSIIFTDKKSPKAFSFSCRKLVAMNVINYVEFDAGKKLFSSCLNDENPEIRSAVLGSLKENHNEQAFINNLLKKMYLLEQNELNGKLKRYTNRGIKNIIVNNPTLVIPLITYFEIIFKKSPTIVNSLFLEDKVLLMPSMRYVFVRNNQYLKQEQREKLLTICLSQKNETLLRIMVLKSLTKEDESFFLDYVEQILKNEKDLLLLNSALGVAEVWKSKALKESLELLAKKNSHKKIRYKASAINSLI